MKQVCKYHPGEEASWYCAHDGLLLCDACAAVQPAETERSAWCFVCNDWLKPVSAGVEGPWFWTILAHFVRYPLAPGPLLATLPLLLVSALAPRDLLGVAAVLVAGLLCGKLGHRIIADSVRGSMNPPGPGAFGERKGWPQGLAQWALFAGAVAGMAAAWWYLGLIAGSLLALVLWCLIPAMVLGVQEEENPAAILDLRNAAATLVALNISYWVLVPVLFAGFLTVSALVSVAVDLLPAVAAWPMSALLVLWFWFAFVHILGYLGHQYAGPLGFSRGRKGRSNRNAARPEAERRREVLMKAGQYGKVVKAYRQLLEKNSKSLQYHDEYFKLLSSLRDHQALLEHACEYLNAVHLSGQDYRLPSLVSFYRELDPAFKPDTGQLSRDLAGVLADQGRYKEAVQMLQDLHKRAPTWPGVAEAYLFVARVLAEQFQLTGKAGQFIKFVEQRYRDQQVQDEAAQCRRELGLTG
jgi:tetratricopeptide (TPR) repeat protein